MGDGDARASDGAMDDAVRGARETVGLTTTRNDAATRADEGDSFAR